jgi:hypothetical protein
MRERKDMGDIHTGEIVPPTRTGKKAVVEMEVKVYVEVLESDDYTDMVEQAKDSLNKRVVESPTFYPISSRAERVHTGMKVADFAHRTYVDSKGQW